MGGDGGDRGVAARRSCGRRRASCRSEGWRRPPRPPPDRGRRLARSGDRVRDRSMGAARHDLRGAPAPTGIGPRAGGSRFPPACLARPEDLQLHVAARLPVQRRSSCPCERLQAGDRAHARPASEVAMGRVHEGDRGRPGGASGQGAHRGGRRRTGEHAFDPPEAARPDVHALDDLPVRRPAGASVRPRGDLRVPVGRPVLRGGAPPSRDGRDPAQPVLRRSAPAPRRRVHRGPASRVLRRDPEPRRERRRRLGMGAARGTLRPTKAARGALRRQQVPLLRPARRRIHGLRLQHVPPALP